MASAARRRRRSNAHQAGWPVPWGRLSPICSSRRCSFSGSSEAIGRLTRIEMRAAEHLVGFGEGMVTLGLAAGRRRGVGHAPVRRHRLARPERADLRRRVVADGEDEVHVRRARRSELVPAFRAGEGGVVVEPLQEIDGERVRLRLRMGAGRVAPELAGALAVQDRLGHDRAGRIAGAEKQHVIGPVHCNPLSSLHCADAAERRALGDGQRPCTLSNSSWCARIAGSLTGSFGRTTSPGVPAWKNARSTVCPCAPGR